MKLLRGLRGFLGALAQKFLAIFYNQTGEGWRFLILAGACGLLSIGSSSWSNIPLLISLMLLSLWWLAMRIGVRALQKIILKRSCAERVFANETLSVSVLLSNSSAWPCAGLLLTEQLENDGASAETPVRGHVVQGGAFATIVPGRGQERLKYGLTVRRRGIYRFGQSTLETAFPLGFFKSVVARAMPGRLVVYPGLGEVDSAFFQDVDTVLEQIRHWRPTRAEEDFRGLREYRQGDNPRWVHWKSSARLQRVLVKEFEEPQARRVVLILDTNLQRLGVQRFPAFETAISFVGSAARDLARRGCEVECVALQPGERSMRVTVSRERRNLDTLLEMLAALTRDDRRTLKNLAGHIGRHSLRRAYVLVLGLGSLRAKAPLGWLNTGDNAVKILDCRSDEFKRIFRRTSGGSRDEDMLMELGDEQAGDEESVLAVAGS